MTQFKVGDTVILDRAREIFKHGTNTRFDRRLYRAWAKVQEVLTDGRMVLEWFDIPDGKSRGSHGAGIGRDYLIHVREVVTGEYQAEDPESVAKRLADMRRDEGTTEAPESVSEALRDCQTPIEKVDTVTNDGLMSADGAGRGAALAHGDRQKAYGHPKVSFDRIASLWSTYLSAPQIDPENLSAEDVGHLMNLLKISRSITDKSADSIDDIEGYVTCIRMIRQAEAE